MTTEITKMHRKPDEWHEKLQGSQYDQNDEITVTRNDEKLEVTLKSLNDWPSKSQYILCILTIQQNSMNDGKRANLRTQQKTYRLS